MLDKYSVTSLILLLLYLHSPTLIGRDTCLPHARLHVLENLLGTAGWSPAAMATGA